MFGTLGVAILHPWEGKVKLEKATLPPTTAHVESTPYHFDASRISGARYQRVATYSVSAGLPSSFSIWPRERASPKSHNFTKQSLSSKTLEGWKWRAVKRGTVREGLVQPSNHSTHRHPARPDSTKSRLKKGSALILE